MTHLAACPEALSPTVRAPGPTPDARTCPGSATAGSPSGAIPRVPGYEVLEELGRGGMGVVYRARQAGLNRLVALKMIQAGQRLTEPALRRFQIEAESVARLQHPGIVQVHEIGWHAGQPYLSMELVEGG